MSSVCNLAGGRGKPFHRIMALVLFAILTACAPTAGDLRDPEAPLGATQRFDTARFAGVWQIVASHDPELAGTLTVTPQGNGLRLSGAISGTFSVPEPGVLRGSDGETLVVMWLDEEFQTASVGALDGDRVMLLSRSGRIPTDKRAAAFEILDFYGWDTARIMERGA